MALVETGTAGFNSLDLRLRLLLFLMKLNLRRPLCAEAG